METTTTQVNSEVISLDSLLWGHLIPAQTQIGLQVQNAQNLHGVTIKSADLEKARIEIDSLTPLMREILYYTLAGKSISPGRNAGVNNESGSPYWRDVAEHFRSAYCPDVKSLFEEAESNLNSKQTA